jgi:hypothetical protein
MVANPKAFISYSWSSPEHQNWVLNLATQLRELRESFALFGIQNTPLYIPHWEFRQVSLKRATNFDKLATKP